MSTVKTKLSPLARFWGLLKPDRKEIRDVYIYGIFNGIIGLSVPLGIQAIVNLIQGGEVNAAWILLVSIVVLGVAFTGILQIFQLRITENIQQKLFTRAALEFAYRVPRIKLEQIYKYYPPELMNRFFDITSVQKGLSKILIDFSSAGLQVIFGLLLLSFYHTFFVLFSLVLLLLVYIIFRFTAKPGLKASLEESRHKYALAHWLEETARTSFTFKLAGNTNLPLHKADVHTNRYLHAREKHFKILIQQYSLLTLFKVLVAAGLLAIGGLLVMQQMMNIGQFVAAEIIIIIVMSSVEKLIFSLETIYDVLTGLEKIGFVTDMELDRTDGIDPKEHCTNEGLGITMDHVSFHYPNGEMNVVKDLSLDIKPGEKLLIIGPNGSGKSTLLQVIAGLYRPTDGVISYGGLNIESLNLYALRELISDVFGFEELFEGSVFENIGLGRGHITESEIIETCKAIGLHSFIAGLPKGHESIIDPIGKKLPSGIRAKILLARAIVGKPKLIVLENAFEHIIPADRTAIMKYIFGMEGCTIVASTRDLKLAELADRVAVMKEGKITNIGNLDEVAHELKYNSHA
ncbi:ATP-binding cassette domain-containing protein [bacterium]|nr:ATP-binding cassette domain-containing protein [bacterium]